MTQPTLPVFWGKKFLLPAIKVLFSAGVLIYAFQSVEVAQLAARLADTSWFALSVAMLLAFGQILAVGQRWFILTRAASIALPLGARNFQLINLAAQFVGQVLPFLAADALRVAYVRSAGVSLRTSLLSAVFDRGIAVFALLVLCATLLVCIPIPSEMYDLRSIIVLLAVASVAGVAGIVIFGERLARMQVRSRIFQELLEILHYCRRLYSNAAVSVSILGLSVLVHCLSILIFWTVCLGQGASIDLTKLLIVVPVLLLSSAVPISIAGWGVREGLAVSLFHLLGVASDAALAASLTFGAIILIATLPGAPLLLSARKEGALER